MYNGKIRIEVPRVADVDGNFIAKAYRGSDLAVLTEATNAVRITAIAAVITALASLVEGDLSSNHLEVTTPNTLENQ